MPGIGVLGVTVVPPEASTCFSASSIASTSIVITGEGVVSVRCIMPPLIAPASVGSCVCWSTGVVITVVLLATLHRCGLQLPAEDRAVEVFGPIQVFRRNLEVDHFAHVIPLWMGRFSSLTLRPSRVTVKPHSLTDLSSGDRR